MVMQVSHLLIVAVMCCLIFCLCICFPDAHCVMAVPHWSVFAVIYISVSHAAIAAVYSPHVTVHYFYYYISMSLACYSDTRVDGPMRWPSILFRN